MVELLQIIFLNQTLDHVITRNEDVVGFAVGNFNIHLFIGIKVFHNDFGSGLFFKVLNNIFSRIFAPVVNVKCLTFIGPGRICGSEAGEEHSADKDRCRCEGRNPFFAADFLMDRVLCRQHRGHIDNNEHYGNDDNHKG